ncbi:hypothetical protein BB558_006048 [Smittium angustum]|uniref:Mediator of RNA polymerase II transcription subunit 17 n=1 Tax=Smittium angustum TaxID=133377 RepID=A0A2U1IYV0_SMIAN|nr:hypothetical protein BB558_006048 [Smittium angustum]
MRNIVITGSNKGIGKATLVDLALKAVSPTTLYLTSTDTARGQAAVDEILSLNKDKLNPHVKIVFVQLNLADDTSIDNFYNYFAALGSPCIDILINNAGHLNKAIPFSLQETKITFAINFFGTVKFTEKMLPLMKPNSRVIFLTSAMGSLSKYPAHIREKYQDENLTLEKLQALQSEFVQAVADGNYKELGYPEHAYSVSKTGVTAYTKLLAKRFASDKRNIFFACCHPGRVKTDMGGPNNPLSIEEGIANTIHLATEDIQNLGPSGSLQEKLQNRIAVLWQEHPNFENLNFSKSSVDDVPENIKDDITSIKAKSSSKTIKSEQKNIESTSELLQNLRNKLWYARSEMAVALDVIINLQNSFDKQNKNVSKPTSEKPNSIGSNSAEHDEFSNAILTMDNTEQSRPSESERILQYKLSMGGKQKQLEESSKYLESQFKRLENIVSRNKKLFQGATKMRDRHWIIQQHESVLDGVQFFISFDYRNAGSRFGERGYSKIQTIEKGDLNKSQTEDAYRNEEPQLLNKTEESNSADVDFSINSEKLIKMKMGIHVHGKYNSSKHNFFSTSGKASIEETKLGIEHLCKESDRYDQINKQLIMARNSIYLEELFRRLMNEALLFSKGTVVSGNKEHVSNEKDVFKETDTSKTNSNTDFLNIPLDIDKQNLFLQFRISNLTGKKSNLNSKNTPDYMDFDKPSTQNDVIIKIDDVESNQMDVDSDININKTKISSKIQDESKRVHKTSIIDFWSRIAPDLALILSSMLLCKQYRFQKRIQYGLLTNLGSNMDLLVPVTTALSYLFNINQIDNLARNVALFWKNTIYENAFFSSNVFDFFNQNHSNVYYTAHIILGNQSSFLIKILHGGKVQLYHNSNIYYGESSYSAFPYKSFGNVFDAFDHIRFTVLRLLLIKISNALNYFFLNNGALISGLSSSNNDLQLVDKILEEPSTIEGNSLREPKFNNHNHEKESKITGHGVTAQLTKDFTCCPISGSATGYISIEKIIFCICMTLADSNFLLGDKPETSFNAKDSDGMFCNNGLELKLDIKPLYKELASFSNSSYGINKDDSSKLVLQETETKSIRIPLSDLDPISIDSCMDTITKNFTNRRSEYLEVNGQQSSGIFERVVAMRILEQIITKEVSQQISSEVNKYRIGIVNIFLQHSSASLTINENADSDVRTDMDMILDKIAPYDAPYTHTYEGKDDMPGHVKSSLMGVSLNIPIKNGKLALGTWQG